MFGKINSRHTVCAGYRAVFDSKSGELDEGVEFVGKPAEYGQQVRAQYTERDYHKPSDIVRPDWDLSGAREDLMVFLAVGYRVAEADKLPEWAPGNEFKAKRDAQLKNAGGQY